jgi:hypothetical protein
MEHRWYANVYGKDFIIEFQTKKYAEAYECTTSYEFKGNLTCTEYSFSEFVDGSKFFLFDNTISIGNGWETFRGYYVNENQIDMVVQCGEGHFYEYDYISFRRIR